MVSFNHIPLDAFEFVTVVWAKQLKASNTVILNNRPPEPRTFFLCRQTEKPIDNSYNFALTFVQHKKPRENERRLRRNQTEKETENFFFKKIGLSIKPNLNQEVRV